jgi:hypothetical protein
MISLYLLVSANVEIDLESEISAMDFKKYAIFSRC